jgi:hypothetical protein
LSFAPIDIEFALVDDFLPPILEKWNRRVLSSIVTVKTPEVFDRAANLADAEVVSMSQHPHTIIKVFCFFIRIFIFFYLVQVELDEVL